MTAGLVASSIGSGLTVMVVFGELLRLHASAVSLALAFVLTTAPSLLGSKLGEKLIATQSPFLVLIVGEFIGLAGLSIPFLGVHHASVFLLQCAECCASFSFGMTLPALSLVLKRGLPEEQLPAAASYETIVFTANVLFGVGLGVLLFGRVATPHILMADGVSYLVSAFLIAMAWKKFPGDAGAGLHAEESPVRLHWKTLSRQQKRGLLLLPLLALVASPGMALLPKLYVVPGIETALFLLFARSLGQLVAPLLIPVGRFKAWSQSNTVLFISLFIFCVGYLLVPIAGRPWQAAALILMAHLFSNVVFALAWYVLLAHFDERQVAFASARAYQWQVAAICAASLVAGLLADMTTARVALWAMSGLGGAAVVWFVATERAAGALASAAVVSTVGNVGGSEKS